MEKNNWYRALNIIVMVTLVTGLLSACSIQPPTPTVLPTATIPPRPDYVNAAGVFPIATKELTLKFVVPATPNITDYSTNAFTKFLELKSGCKIQFEQYPLAEMETKVQLSLASATGLPDAYLGLAKAGSQIFSTTNVIRYGDEGQLISLNKYIDDYGVATKEAFKTYSTGSSLKQMMTSADGKIYYMPVLVVGKVSRTSNKLWLNQKWLTKLSLKIPTTTEELYNVLKAFKEQDPNGNKKADEIPLVGTDQNYMYAPVNYLLGSFVENNPKVNRLTVDKSGKLVYQPITAEWREAMKYINRLTSEGLLSPLSFTQKLDTLKQIASDPNDICGGFVALGVNHIVTDNAIVANYVGVAPVAGPAGVRLAVDNPPVPAGAGVITSACKYPEVVFRIFDLMISDDAARQSRYGEMGVDWEDPKTGELDRFGKQATVKVLIDNWGKVQNKIWWGLNPNISDKYNEGSVAATLPLAEQKNSASSIEYMNYLPTSTISMITYDLASVARVNELKTALDNYVLQTIAKFAVGQYDPKKDADWEKYLQEFKSIGLDEFMTVSQKAYATMAK